MTCSVASRDKHVGRCGQGPRGSRSNRRLGTIRHSFRPSRSRWQWKRPLTSRSVLYHCRSRVRGRWGNSTKIGTPLAVLSYPQLVRVSPLRLSLLQSIACHGQYGTMAVPETKQSHPLTCTDTHTLGTDRHLITLTLIQ
jgi:hypothetical protein